MSDTRDRVEGAMGGFMVGAWTGFWMSGCNPVGALVGGGLGAASGVAFGTEKTMEIAAEASDDSPDPHMPFGSAPYFDD